MTTTHAANIALIKLEIAAQLGYDPKNPPVQVDPAEAADVLTVKETTLAVWRSTGRYNLPFVKGGRLVRYRVNDLAQFLVDRTAGHTGEVA